MDTRHVRCVGLNIILGVFALEKDIFWKNGNFLSTLYKDIWIGVSPIGKEADGFSFFFYGKIFKP